MFNYRHGFFFTWCHSRNGHLSKKCKWNELERRKCSIFDLNQPTTHTFKHVSIYLSRNTNDSTFIWLARHIGIFKWKTFLLCCDVRKQSEFMIWCQFKWYIHMFDSLLQLHWLFSHSNYKKVSISWFLYLALHRVIDFVTE